MIDNFFYGWLLHLYDIAFWVIRGGEIKLQLKIYIFLIYFQADICRLSYTLQTPNVCEFVGMEIPEKTTTIKPDEAGEIVKPDDHEAAGGSALVTILIISTIMVGVVGSAYYLYRNPDKRSKVLSLFRRRNVPVQYTRVST